MDGVWEREQWRSGAGFKLQRLIILGQFSSRTQQNHIQA
jgi:hypothetical protein